MTESSDLLAHGWLWAFATVFVGGFLTSLTPCVYPMISITVSLFGAREEKVTRATAMGLAAMYVLGMAVMYTALGVGFSLAGRQFGTFLASPWVVGGIAVFFVVMAASMFGAFELDLPSGLKQRLSKAGGKGVVGSFLMGLVGGIVAAPCTGPVLASVLAYVATTRSVFLGGSLLFTYAVGMGVLFFVVAAFAVSLPKSGAWMDGVKSVFGVIMIVAALYFLRNVSKPLGGYGSWKLSFLAANVVALLIGILVGGIHLNFKYSPWSEKLRKAVGVVLVVAGSFGVLAWVLTAKPLDWVHGEKAGLAAAKAAHKPAFLDFYADWCLPCKEMELTTFHDPAVEKELARFALVKVDCTRGDEDPEVAAAQEKYKADTLPTLAIVDSNGQIATTIHKVVSAKELLPILQEIK
jgi:thiol:disulfide interchange protein DsbD